MYREMLKSKIHRATITGADVDYEGSIMIDEDLMKQVDLLHGEKVLIANLNNGARVETYVIKGKAGSGVIAVNGSAALLNKVGEKVIIMNFCMLDEREVVKHTPKIVVVDVKNRPVR